eukprot:g4461.t1 g4461   contig15:1077699-1078718(+)
MNKCISILLATATSTSAFVTHQGVGGRYAVTLHAEKQVGVFFGTSTGSTEEAAELIVSEFGDVAAGPIDIDGVAGSVAKEFAKYDALVVGTPTWNTGADTERSGTGWDEIYYSEMQDLDIAGKKVAVFGLGDSVSYCENYADATGELHDVFEALGCKMMGYTSVEGYLHEESKAQRGEKFCGLPLDAVNQEELTEERVQKWVAALIAEGILEGGGEATSTAAVSVPIASPVAAVATTAVEVEIVSVSEPASGYVGHYNPRSDKTMWISVDGHSSYVTSGAP